MAAGSINISDKEAVLENYSARAKNLAAAAEALKRRSGAAAPFSLAFLTDCARASRPELVARALPAGAALILRDYNAPARKRLAARLAAIAKARGILFLVGNDPYMARALGANGAHFPAQAPLPPKQALAGLIVTCAAHNEAELARAEALGADAIFLSPAFSTLSHPGEAALPPWRFRALAGAAPAPVLALGGVDEKNAWRIAGPNIAGFGAIGAFLPG